MRAYRLHSTPGGMKSLAALTPDEAGYDVAAALAAGARSVEVEEFDARSDADLNDAWRVLRDRPTETTT